MPCCWKIDILKNMYTVNYTVGMEGSLISMY